MTRRAPCAVHRDRKKSGLYYVVYAGPTITIQRISRGFWQLVDSKGGSSDHDLLREARIAASDLIARRP